MNKEIEKESYENKMHEAKGGKMEIPDGWFVHKVDLDAQVPYCVIMNIDLTKNQEKAINIPPSLAYYLRTHFCGSEKMHNDIFKDGQRNIQNQIKRALGVY